MPCSANAAVAPPGFPFSTEDNPPLTASTFFVASPTTDPTDHSVTVIDGKNANWTSDLSATLYRIDKWGPPYFSVNASGDISVHPYGSSTLSEQEIDLMKIVKKVSDPESAGGLGLRLPLIIQFPEILKNRLDSLNAAFNYAIQSLGYQNRYQGVYPVKCNQHRFIVEDVVKFGYSYQFGLEAGSKPELLLAMSCLSKGHPDAFLVCNGYKDVEFIYLALFARKLGFNTFIVLEQEEEIDIVIDLSKKLNMDPVIGIRAKLRAQHGGHYGPTSGEKGKFGLNTTEIMQVVTKLQNEGMLACLKLLHFHVGSQIPSTDDIAAAVKEASQIYCKLATNGAPMQILDVGGGLGIDYDGSMCGESADSVGYTMKEYAETVVLTIQDVCDSNNIDHPVICSESGRAIVSHQSILVFNIISSREYDAPELSAAGLKYLVEGFSEDVRAHYKNLHAAAVRGDRDICLHHTKQLKQRCIEQFKQGSLGIEQLAAVDGLCKLVAKVTEDEDPERYYQMNLSMFTSIVDFLLVDQLFPIVPIHRLAERPTITGVLSDLTCDSDGKITKFIGGKSSLLLHELEGDEGEYYLGMFLGGAYEEAIGGVHNLLGFTTIVQVEPSSDVDDGFEVKRVKLGMSISDVLQRMSYDPNSVLETIKQLATAAGQSTDGLDCFFSNVPYLVSSSPCVDSALNNN